MKRLGLFVIPLMLWMAWPSRASACPYIPFTGGGTTNCPVFQDPPDPPPPPPEPNRMSGPDGQPIPTQNRCGDDQIPPGDCPQYQNLAYYTYGCINYTEFAYAQSHSLAPICSPIVHTDYVGFCRCGCLERHSEIFVQSPKGKSTTERIDQITVGSRVPALTGDATLSSIRYAPRGVEAVTVGPERNPLVVLHLEGGVVLAATEHHAVLIATGQMVAAQDLKPGQLMVRQDGTPIRIDKITREPTSDNVYNILTDALLDHKGHIIVANGLIIGDLMWQNTLAKDLNSIELRR